MSSPDSTPSIALRRGIASLCLGALLGAASPAVAGETTLWSFAGGSDGAGPLAGAVVDSAGNVYGTTMGGGGIAVCQFYQDCGAVYKLTPSSSGYMESVIWSFGNTGDGRVPLDGLLLGKGGTLFGMTKRGGAADAGTVFELIPSGSGYIEQILWSFAGGTDGRYPDATLVTDKRGNLYGTTEFGGAYNGGTVFELVRSSKGYAEAILWSFAGGADGAVPYGQIFRDKVGAIYGSTLNGGNPNCEVGCGTIFRLVPGTSSYSESVVYAFQGGVDGSEPTGATAGPLGSVFGMTSGGGTHNGGTAFKLTPGSSGFGKHTIWNFGGAGDGAYPANALVIGRRDNLFGTTSQGGIFNRGTLFTMALSHNQQNWNESLLYSFGGDDGQFPESSVFVDKSGILYGTAVSGGAHGSGAVFAFQ